MPKITFKAELRIPRQVVLPLPVAYAAQSPRVIVIDSRKMELHDSIADHLVQRYPKWMEPKAQETEPTDEKPLEKMTIAELTALAEAEGIDLGKVRLHADIVKVIADHQATDEDDEPASDDEAAGEQDPDADGDESEDQEADEQEPPDSDA